jgi:hypothetical protein
MLFKNSVRTSKRTPHFTITAINFLTLFKFNPFKTKRVRGSERWIDKYLEGGGRGLNKSHYPGTRLEGHVKTTENLSQDIRSLSRDLKPAPPEYESGMLDHDVRCIDVDHVLFQIVPQQFYSRNEQVNWSVFLKLPTLADSFIGFQRSSGPSFIIFTTPKSAC